MIVISLHDLLWNTFAILNSFTKNRDETPE